MVHSSVVLASDGQHQHKDDGEKSEQDGEGVEEEAVEGGGQLFPRHITVLCQTAGRERLLTEGGGDLVQLRQRGHNALHL